MGLLDRILGKGSKGGKTELTPKQLQQRKYAAEMKAVRSRAKDTKGGKGRIKDRSTAKGLRKKYGLKDGK